ncbi:hypothetical protein C8R41DRAFT_868485 [Lentinula lateritia]|uniref:Uncharacterized protein n=1 Tax=Lentinula lateritia TaxID=40482 RepID=A0ABQ8VDR8_9AGAR|nr:hypothetical protein C8R41DRAFT_868485 [Lentinula lateritia]
MSLQSVASLPMAQDDPPSDEEWFTPSGKEGTLPSGRHCSSVEFSTPRDDGLHHLSPGPWGNVPREPMADALELSPSIRMRDFAEVVVRPVSAVPAHHRQQLTSHRGPFWDLSLASVSGHGLQPAPDIRAHKQRGRTSYSHHSRFRARTREPSPGPDFGAHLRRPSRSLSPVVRYPPAQFDAASLRASRDQGQHHLSSTASSSYPPSYGAATEQHVPVKNRHRFRDPRQGEISLTVPAAMLNQVHPLVISALRTGWPSFISLNYFSRRMSEVGKSLISSGMWIMLDKLSSSPNAYESFPSSRSRAVAGTASQRTCPTP